MRPTVLRSLGLTLTLGGCALACNDIGKALADKISPPSATPATESDASSNDAEASLLEPHRLSEALDRLIRPRKLPVRVLSIIAVPSQVVLQVQDIESPTGVYQYAFKGEGVLGPVPVKLMGEGKLRDNLFRLQSADPHVAETVLSTVSAQYTEPVRKIVMVRNLPTSMDIQFRVYLQTPSGDRIIAADKHGRILGPLTPPGRR